VLFKLQGSSIGGGDMRTIVLFLIGVTALGLGKTFLKLYRWPKAGNSPARYLVRQCVKGGDKHAEKPLRGRAKSGSMPAPAIRVAIMNCSHFSCKKIPIFVLVSYRRRVFPLISASARFKHGRGLNVAGGLLWDAPLCLPIFEPVLGSK
jgi:hypothetical protein